MEVLHEFTFEVPPSLRAKKPWHNAYTPAMDRKVRAEVKKRLGIDYDTMPGDYGISPDNIATVRIFKREAAHA